MHQVLLLSVGGILAGKGLWISIAIGAAIGAVAGLSFKARKERLTLDMIVGVAGSILGHKFLLKFASSLALLKNDIARNILGALILGIIFGLLFRPRKSRDHTQYRA
jgi:uncharacterized membrane protein YeaQ/YmgE (transglycosylase-associated protein family)